MRLEFNPSRRFVVTGASGFIGSVVCKRLRNQARLSLGASGWREALGALDLKGATVIHLAARVHDPQAAASAYENDNVVKTVALAEAAARAGAERFVFASTVKVFGEESTGRPFREGDPPRPADAYAVSKWRAEAALRELSGRTGLPLVIVRIPLVYGRGAAGNFQALVRLADTRFWLPFSAIANRRSLVHVDDLADAIEIASTHPGARGRMLMAAHPEPVSTPLLVRAIRKALGRPPRLFSVAPGLLEAMAAMVGQGERMKRLTRSLEVDSESLIQELAWSPRMTLEAGLAGWLSPRSAA